MADVGAENLAKSRELKLDQPGLLEPASLPDNILETLSHAEIRELGHWLFSQLVGQRDLTIRVKDAECEEKVAAKSIIFAQASEEAAMDMKAKWEKAIENKCQARIKELVGEVVKGLSDLSFRHNPIGKQRVDNFIKFIERLKAKCVSSS